nr:CheR family methyltransferase [Sulfurimonas sp. MAG313]
MIRQDLINALTTNETYFYREFSQIKELLSVITSSKKSSVKILCAPCATGEEPYSIVIAILEKFPSMNVHIVGIDINTEALKKAKKASYTFRHVNKLPTQLLEKYFTSQKETYELKDDIKDKVTLKQANIFDDSFKDLGKFDYVFSRNMLIYFEQETKLKAKKILESMRIDNTTDVFLGHADLFE